MKLSKEIYARAKAVTIEVDENTKGMWLRDASEEFVRLIWRFKNPAFAAEKEWRLMTTLMHLPERLLVGFRTSRLGIVPYYEHRNCDQKQKLPIKSVTVGPTPYGAISNHALDLFMKDSGYSVRTSHSTIPIRR